MMLNNNIYDNLKKIALTWFPAAIVLYNTIAIIWGAPYTQEITATLGAIEVFFGVILSMSSKTYKKMMDHDSTK